MKTLQQITLERQELFHSKNVLIANHEKNIIQINSQIESLNRAERILLADLDLRRIEGAEEIIYWRGNPDNVCDDRMLTEAAALDIAAGGAHLKSNFFGNKQYSGYYQSTDCTYGYGPKHGAIVDEIGLKPAYREKDLTPGEVEDVIYYLKNFKKIKSVIKATT